MSSGSPSPDPSTAPPAADMTALANALVSAMQTTPITTTPAVPAPIMGGIHERSATDHVPWTGGKPKPDWSGLDDSADKEHSSPTQYRSVTESVSTLKKSYAYRVKGMESKLTQATDISSFQKQFLERLVQEGMDTISYVPDPMYPKSKMISCVSDHTRLTLDTVVEAMKDQVKLYDSYDKANDKHAVQLLLNSLDEEVKKEVRTYHEATDTFPVLWMRVMKCGILTPSIDYFDNIKKQLKLRKATDYPGQNLANLCAAYQDDASKLETGGQYEHKLTKDMLDCFIRACTVHSTAEDSPSLLAFRNKLLKLHTDIDGELVDLNYLTCDKASDHMRKQGLHYKKILEDVASSYRNLESLGQWPAARSNPDSKKAPAAFGHKAATDDIADLQLQLNALKQTLNISTDASKDRSNDTCLHCGKTGHWAKDCPMKQRDGKSPRDHRRRARDGRQNHRRNRGGRGNGRGRGNEPPKESWKTTPPGSGEPQTKEVRGRQFKWCEACHRWSTTHGTSTHRGPQPPADQANNLIIDPSAWCLPLDLCGPPSWSSVFRHLLLPFLGSAIGMLIVGLFAGWTLGTVATPLSILAHLRENHAWYLTLANLATLFKGSRALGASTAAWLQRPPPKPSYPLPRWARRKGQAHRKRVNRCFNNLARASRSRSPSFAELSLEAVPTLPASNSSRSCPSGSPCHGHGSPSLSLHLPSRSFQPPHCLLRLPSISLGQRSSRRGRRRSHRHGLPKGTEWVSTTPFPQHSISSPRSLLWSHRVSEKCVAAPQCQEARQSLSRHRQFADLAELTSFSQSSDDISPRESPNFG